MRLFRFTKPNKITFRPYNVIIEAIEAYPVPAPEKFPDWYKKLPQFINNSGKEIKARGVKDLKTCVPYRDALITGYMLISQADIEVSSTPDGDVNIFWNKVLPLEVVHKRGNTTSEQCQGYGMPVPAGHSPILFAWSATFGVQTNKAHSVLITHPLNRHDLPFTTTSGIIDSGYFTTAGNVPFFIKEGFNGVIPKGTPIAQVIPFRREDWKQDNVPSDELAYSKFMALRDSYLTGFYARFLRQPRSFK